MSTNAKYHTDSAMMWYCMCLLYCRHIQHER